MADQAVGLVKRADGLEGVQATPVFFAIDDGEHVKSVLIIEELRKSYNEEDTRSSTPLCLLFESFEQAVAAIVDPNAVMIFDSTEQKGYIAPLYRGQRKNSSKFSEVFRRGMLTLWGIAANSNLKSGGIVTAARQLKADFDFNFFARLDAGKLPWGNFVSPDNGRKRRQRSRPRGRRKDYSERHSIW